MTEEYEIFFQIGTFLLGLSTLILTTYTVFSLSRWKKEKLLEKKSNIAEESLNNFETAIEK